MQHVWKQQPLTLSEARRRNKVSNAGRCCVPASPPGGVDVWNEVTLWVSMAMEKENLSADCFFGKALEAHISVSHFELFQG